MYEITLTEEQTESGLGLAYAVVTENNAGSRISLMVSIDRIVTRDDD